MGPKFYAVYGEGLGLNGSPGRFYSAGFATSLTPKWNKIHNNTCVLKLMQGRQRFSGCRVVWFGF